MKRIFLPAAAVLLSALLLAGCTVTGGRVTVTDPPMVTSNVTSSPAPVTPTQSPVHTPTAAPEHTNAPTAMPSATPGLGEGGSTAAPSVNPDHVAG